MYTLPVSFLHECLAYDPETGVLTWRARPSEHFVREERRNAWNARLAGKVAGTVDKEGYLVVTLTLDGKERQYRTARVIFTMMTGRWPENEIDHKNRVKSDNRWANLREAKGQNQQNIDTSKVVGATWIPHLGKWRAHLGIEGKSKIIGYFLTREEAQAAYLKAKRELHSFWSG